MADIEYIIKNAEIFKNSSVTYKLLEGGFVNKIYKVKCGDKIYCVRINNPKQARLFGLDASKEAEACRQASLLSIAPAVYNINDASEYLITDFFPGKYLSGEEARNPEIVKKYVAAIKLIHENIKVERNFSIFDLIDKYISGAEICRVNMPENLNKVLVQVEKIRKFRSCGKLLNNVFCHNDIWHNNILYDGNKIYIIDWEFCGYGDGFFDFAHIANIIGGNFSEEKFMLQTYFGYFEQEMWDILQQMKYISGVYGAAWYIFHTGIADDAGLKYRYLQAGEEAVNQLAEQDI